MRFHDGGGEIREYADGEMVFCEGDEGRYLYVILQGKVLLRKEGDLVATVLDELSEGEMFGELALIEDKTHSASAVTGGPARLALYDKETFLASLREDPELALRVIASLAGRLRRTTETLQQVCVQHVLDRTEMQLIQKAVLESELM